MSPTAAAQKRGTLKTMNSAPERSVQPLASPVHGGGGRSGTGCGEPGTGCWEEVSSDPKGGLGCVDPAGGAGVQSWDKGFKWWDPDWAPSGNGPSSFWDVRRYLSNAF